MHYALNEVMDRLDEPAFFDNVAVKGSVTYTQLGDESASFALDIDPPYHIAWCSVDYRHDDTMRKTVESLSSGTKVCVVGRVSLDRKGYPNVHVDKFLWVTVESTWI